MHLKMGTTMQNYHVYLKRKFNLLSLVVLYIVLLGAPRLATATDISWVNPAGGNWSNPTNWDAGRVPSNGDKALITIDGTYTVTLDIDATVSGLTVGGANGVQTLSNAAFTLTLNGTSVIETNGAMNQSGGVLFGNALLTVNGIYNWSGGSMYGPSATTVTAAGQMNISGGANKVLARFGASNGGHQLNNSGIITWTGTGQIIAGEGAVINNLSGGLFDCQNDSTFDYINTGDIATFNNQVNAVLRKSAGNGATTFSTFILNNSSLLDVQTGLLSFTAGNVTHTFSDGTMLRGSGSVQLAGSNITMSGTISDNGTFEFAAGVISVFAGLPTTWAGSGVFNWTGGNFYGTGSTNVAANFHFNISGAANKVLARFGASNGGHQLNNAGVITWTGTGQIVAGEGAMINNLSGGLFDCQNDSTFDYINTGDVSTFNNQAGAILRKSNSTGTTTFGTFVLNNDSILDIQTGSLNLTAGNVTHHLNDGSILQGSGLIQLNGSNLTASGTVTDNGLFQFASGVISSNAAPNWTGSGTFNWTGGSFYGTGSTNIAANFHFNISGGADKVLARFGASNGGHQLNNSGVITWTGTGRIVAGEGATINNLNGGLFDCQNDSTFDYINTGDVSTFNNQSGAIFRKSVGSGSSTFGTFILNNTGTLDVQTGVLDLTAGNVTHLLSNGSLLQGAGLVRLNGSNVLESGTITDNGTFEFATGVINAAGTATWTGSGVFNWTGGNFYGTGSTNVATNFHFNISGAANKVLARFGASNGGHQLNNSGVITWTGTGQIVAGEGAVINNLSGGLFDCQNDSAFAYINTGDVSTFNNQSGAIFRKSLSNGSTTFATFLFGNAGTIDVRSGTLVVNNGYTQTAGSTLLNGGNVTAGGINMQGGTLEGAGTVTSNVTNSGAVSPGLSPGCLTISGNYTQTASGTLRLAIGGLTACSEFDQLNVTGTATLNGTLKLNLINDFVPAVGDTFQVITYASHMGSFAAITGSYIGNGRKLQISYNPTDVRLTVINIPPVVVTNTNSSGPGSLRQAILDVNVNPGAVIQFHIPLSDSGYDATTGVFTIAPTTPLPDITADGTFLDGAAQTAFTGDSNLSGPEIALNGASIAATGTTGLTFNGASNGCIQDLIINGFNGNGIRIVGPNATGNCVQGCYIGTDVTGTTALANGLNGIAIASGAQNNLIGGTATGAANRIAFNTGDGVVVTGAATTGNTVVANSIANNAGLGINLQPTGEAANTVTDNDVGDADTGPNNLQNYPVITNATTLGNTTTVAGTLNSTANTTFTLDCYRNSAADASGFGEGEVYAGSQDVTTDAAGNASFSFALTGTFTGQVFTVTATNKATGDTSEFAQDKSATAAALTLSVTPSLFNEGAGNKAATGTVTRNTFTGVPLVVNLASSSNRVKVPASVTIPAGATSATFSIDAVDNSIADGSATITLTATAGGLPSATATLTVTDNDTPGITVTPTSGLVTTEAGGTATFKVVLNSQPVANVTLGLTSSNTAEGTVAPNTLTFTSANWNVPQTVTVTGVDDAIADGNQPYTIITAPAVSTDSNYNKLDAADVSVVNQDNESPTLTLSANLSTIVEGASTSLTLTRNTPIAAPLTVNLSSSDNGSLPVPSTITIPAGAASVTFSVTAVDDNVVNGTRTANLTASLSGFTAGSIAITVTDNDVTVVPTPTPTPVPTPVPTVPPGLTVTLSPATVSEAAGVSASHGTVTRHDAPTTAPLSVQISTNTPGKATPAITTVSIPKGAVSSTFAIDAVDNAIVDGTQSVTFTAAANGFTSGNATLTVTDDDKPTLTLSITPNRLRETGGARAGQGTVTRNTATDEPLVVQLSNSNTTKLRVPPSVTIPAQAVSAIFAVSTLNDNQPKGPRLVTVTARALGFVSGTAQAIVTDAAPASNLSFGGQVTVVPSSVAHGAPTGIGGATVTLLQKGIAFDAVLTDASGHYQFTNLPVGSYTVTVQKDSYRSFSPASRTVEISPKGASTGNNFVGTPQGRFSGRITQRLEDGTIKGLPGITVNAYSAQGVLIGRTNSLGQFALATGYVSQWVVLPMQRGTYFKPTTRLAALSPTTPLLSNLDFTAAGTDATAPVVNILTPHAGSFSLSTQPTQVTGNAADKGGAGVAVVTVALARFATATATVPAGFWNWKTNAFISGDNPLLVERIATGTTSWTLSGLPKLPAGFYGLRATVLDGAANKTISRFVRYSLTTPTTTRAASPLTLSTAAAQAGAASIKLRFFGPLEPETAGDAAHYTVKVNGHSVGVETAGYDATTHTVILGLPEAALQSGDSVLVHWSDLLDAQQQSVTGEASLDAGP